MTPKECHERAAMCAANASLAASEAIRLEFLNLAAKWRSMAKPGISLRNPDDALEAVEEPCLEATSA
ncbi:hypothetical protein LJR225_002475 [Phenylobacterium sp. LjRoot225]|uniref:hypothetical protein n=1 Tax=Phenylobacterium sp. LjRoot225 TaxID=3342285 RepID=UPI003ECF5615